MKQTKRKKRLLSIGDIIIYVGIIILCALFLYPLIQTLALSVSDDVAMIGKKVYLLPKGFSLNGYKIILSNVEILRYYLNTIIYAVSGTFLTILFTALFAYPISFKEFKGRTLCTVLLTITMFVSAGMIPMYLIINTYKMINTIWAIILPGAVSAYNVILFRTAFEGVPPSLRESAYMDGAGHFRVLFNIIIPLSKPVIACVTLFTVVGYWNSYLDPLIYLDEVKKMPIQIFLRRILVQMEVSAKDDMMKIMEIVNSNPQTVKAAATVVTILPILCIYPFLQKYFAKGVMVGSIKE